jgi:hypothetical protein
MAGGEGEGVGLDEADETAELDGEAGGPARGDPPHPASVKASARVKQVVRPGRCRRTEGPL